MNRIDKSYEIIKTLKTVKEIIKTNFEKSFKELNLTAPQSMLLGILGHNGSMKITQLSDKMGLSNSTVSGIVDRLEAQEFLIRTRDTKDKRVVMVNLTAKFREEAKTKYCSFDSKLSEMIKDASEEDLETALTGLIILNKILRKEEK